MSSKLLFNHFLGASFDRDLWTLFFKLCVVFIKIPFLQLETYVPIKRLKIFNEYGDMRVDIAGVVREMWVNLGTNKGSFIPHLVGDIFSVTLARVDKIRRDTLFLLFDMINFETRELSRNFQVI